MLGFFAFGFRSSLFWLFLLSSEPYGLVGVFRLGSSRIRGVRRVWIFLIRATKYPTATGSPQYRSRATLPSDIQPSDANPDRTLRNPSSYLRVQIQGEQHRQPNCLGSCLLLLCCRCIRDLVEPTARAGDRRLESGTITGRLEISPEPLDDRARPPRFAAVVGLHSVLCIDSRTLVYRLAYNGDVAAGQLAVFQGGPSRTGGKAPISESYGSSPAVAGQKNSQLAAARRVALKMGRR